MFRWKVTVADIYKVEFTPIRKRCVQVARSASTRAMRDMARLIRSPSMAGWKR